MSEMTKKNARKLGRRDLLKLMTAGAGALTVSAFLPQEWVRPVVDVGVLPVHAQASALTGSISGTLTFNGSLLSGTPIGLFSAPFGLATELTTTTSGADGAFIFSGLAPGLYDVAFFGKGDWRYRSDANGSGSFITVTVGGTANGNIIFPYP